MIGSSATRSHAQAPVCKRQPIDVSIVIDFSGSMVYSSTTSQAVNKLADARIAAKQLVADLFAPNDDAVHIGLVSFSTCGIPEQTAIRVPLLGESGKSTLDAAIDALTMTLQESSTHRTCTHEGVQLTNTLLTSPSRGARGGVKKLTVFLTDGVPNVAGLSYDAALQEALTAVATGVAADVSYITVGLGDYTGVELDETLLQCMAGVGTLTDYASKSCLLNRKAIGHYWFAPTSGDLKAIYKAIADQISNTCVTPTPSPSPSPRPTATPLATIRSSIETDPALSGGQSPTLVGLLDPYCASPSVGTPFSAGRVQATRNGVNYLGTVTPQGTYSITNLPNAQGEYCVKFTPNDPKIVCSCPLGCQYCGKSAPTTQDLKFYVTPIGSAWYQTIGGDVGAQTTSGVALSDSIPATCVSPRCNPFLSLPLGGNPTAVGSLVTTKSARVDLGSGFVAPNSYGKHIELDTPLLCKENYDYFYRLYSLGLSPRSDFGSPSDARKPTGAPLNVVDAYYSSTSLAISNQGWSVAAGESLVVFVNGDLRIANTISVANGGFLAFIVKGKIEVDPSVGTNDHASQTNGQVQGVYIANGTIKFTGAAGSMIEKKLVAEGTFAACGGISINRDFTKGGNGLDNNSNPGALFVYRPDFVTNAPKRMKTPRYAWTEISP